MEHPAVRSDESLPELIVRRARATSETRLSTGVAVGVAGAAATLAWRPTLWVLLLSAALCVAAYGTWGIADRELGAGLNLDRRLGTASLRALRAVAAVIGTLAAISLLGGVGALLVGRVIS